MPSPKTPKQANRKPRPGARYFSQAFAENLRVARVVGRLTQAYIAEQMRRQGHRTWTQATVSQVERGERHVNIDELFSLAVLVGKTLPELLDPQNASIDYGVGVAPPAVARGLVDGGVRMRRDSTDGTIVAEPIAGPGAVELFRDLIQGGTQ